VTPKRIVENIDVFDVALAPEDVSAVSDLNRDGRIGPNPDTFNP
jgi:2,5-diketo-D-gluconate reductase A